MEGNATRNVKSKIGEDQAQSRQPGVNDNKHRSACAFSHSLCKQQNALIRLRICTDLLLPYCLLAMALICATSIKSRV